MGLPPSGIPNIFQFSNYIWRRPNLSRLKGDNKEEKDFGNGILSKFTIITFVMTFAFLLSGCGGDGDGDGDSDGDDGDGDCWLQ